jgi:acylglycerol lipase
MKAKDGTELFGLGRDPGTRVESVLCLVHGLGEHTGRNENISSCLENAGYAVMAFDLRGHGKSQGRRGDASSCDVLLDDIDILLEWTAERFPCSRRFLYGHSFGGSLVIGHALNRPAGLSGVVATSPLLRPAASPSSWKMAAARILSVVLPRFPMSTSLDCNGLSRRKDVVDGYTGDPLVHDRITPRLGIDILDFGLRNLNGASGLSLPLLLMHGGSDLITSQTASAEFASKAGDMCQLKIWEGLYHEIHNEPEREQVFACLLEWLGKRSEGTGVS